MPTTIQISDKIRKILLAKRIFERESYSEVIERILEDEMDLNESIKKELKERLANPKLIPNDEVKQRLGF